MAGGSAGKQKLIGRLEPTNSQPTPGNYRNPNIFRMHMSTSFGRVALYTVLIVFSFRKNMFKILATNLVINLAKNRPTI